jgi:hypothetical protein
MPNNNPEGKNGDREEALFVMSVRWGYRLRGVKRQAYKGTGIDDRKVILEAEGYITRIPRGRPRRT